MARKSEKKAEDKKKGKLEHTSWEEMKKRGRLPKLKTREADDKRIVIGITMGDPTGIGPEVIIKSLIDKSIRNRVIPIVFGDKGVLSKVAEDLGIRVRIRELASVENIRQIEVDDKEIYVKSISNLKMTRLRYGRPDRNCGRAMVNYVKEAVDAWKQGIVEGIVTAPINKEIINEAGYRYGGHTEMLAELTGAKEFTMMFVSKHFKVSLVTIHLPLKDVSMRITPQRIYKVGLLSWKTLREFFGIKNPRIGVCGINPHAGEGGMFGDEEKDMIYPAIVSMRAIGIDAEGPLSPDTAFWRAYNKEFDVIVAMYHDQGLIPVKLLDFDNAVNITVGVPIVRTSPAHGTAYNIVGKGIADPSSMKSAINLAVDMILVKKQIDSERQKEQDRDMKKVEDEIKRYRISEEEVREFIYT